MLLKASNGLFIIHIFKYKPMKIFKYINIYLNHAGLQ